MDALLDEHRTILQEVTDLARGARGGLPAAQVGERAARGASALRDHEGREQAMAERALGSAARA